MKQKYSKNSDFRYKFRQTGFYRHFWSAVLHPGNFFLCQKYPFFKRRSALDDRFLGYDYTWYDDIPDGWKKAFGPELCDDIVIALMVDGVKKKDWEKVFRINDIKEKYGALAIYAYSSDRVYKVIEKYKLLSTCYCQKCGKPARYVTKGWVGYYCEDCFVDLFKRNNFTEEQIIDHMFKDRLTKDDIPEISRMSKKGSSKLVKVNIKKEYGIDFKDMWGL